MGDTEEPSRVALTVALGAVETSSPRRARLAVVAWTLALAGIVWIGVTGREADEEADAPIAAPPAAAAATTVPATAAATGSRGTVTYVSAPAVIHHTFGEDGLIGGIVFGDNIPSSKNQADIERDGFRRHSMP
jgi:hypothetical protein